MKRRQQHSIIVSLTKDNGDITPAGYHPITLMNTDYKLLVRIMARRLTPVLEEQLTYSQSCSVPDKSLLEAVSVLRDVVSQAELMRTTLCILAGFQKCIRPHLASLLISNLGGIWHKLVDH